MKVLHVFDHSFPIQSGYAARSDSVLRALRRRGIDTAQMTGPKHDAVDGTLRSSNEIEYIRSRPVDGSGPISQVACIAVTRRIAREAISREQPDLVHAHSPCLNGVAVLNLGVPVVYEMRSSWEDAAVSSGKTTESSVRYRMSRALETWTARRADAVVVICDGLRSDLALRGIPDEKLTVVGNAVDIATLKPATADRIDSLRGRLGLKGCVVLGFFGSYFNWEGLDQLIDVLPRVSARVPQVRVLLAGGGEQEHELRELVRLRGVDRLVQFAGRVNHEEIATYYGVADIMVFPRRRLKITEAVTPLKPLESMHLGTLVLASDVGGHRELIHDGETGHLFRADDGEALIAALLGLIENRDGWTAVRDRARHFVLAERTWDAMAMRYERLYEAVLTR